MAIALIVWLSIAFPLSAQPDAFEPIRVFEGKWEGRAKGKPGAGVSTREYKLELGGRFLTARNRSVYEPREPGGKSEVHEDSGIFSYDRAQKRIILRQFHIEGFVNEYVMEPGTASATTIEFVTVRIENIPPGWRAREQYRILGKDEIIESFYLAPPGKDFELYSETHLKRVR